MVKIVGHIHQNSKLFVWGTIMPSEPIAIDDIVAAFKFNKGKYVREMVEAAIHQQAEITPRLIEVLQRVIEDPQPFVD